LSTLTKSSREGIVNSAPQPAEEQIEAYQPESREERGTRGNNGNHGREEPFSINSSAYSVISACSAFFPSPGPGAPFVRLRWASVNLLRKKALAYRKFTVV